MGQVGYNVPPKGKRGIRNQGHQELQFSFAWKKGMESISPPRQTLGSSIGFKIRQLEEYG